MLLWPIEPTAVNAVVTRVTRGVKGVVSSSQVKGTIVVVVAVVGNVWLAAPAHQVGESARGCDIREHMEQGRLGATPGQNGERDRLLSCRDRGQLDPVQAIKNRQRQTNGSQIQRQVKTHTSSSSSSLKSNRSLRVKYLNFFQW